MQSQPSAPGQQPPSNTAPSQPNATGTTSSPMLSNNTGVFLCGNTGTTPSIFGRGTSTKITPKRSALSLNSDRIKRHARAGLRDEFLDGIESLLRDPKYGDLTIKCGDDTYAVHKTVVCTQSAFFAKACDGGFKEASPNTIALHEEPALVKQMIQYFHTANYEVESSILSVFFPSGGTGYNANKATQDTTGISAARLADEGNEDQTSPPNKQFQKSPFKYRALSFHIQMYSLADRMFVLGLKQLAKLRALVELLERVNQPSFVGGIEEIYTSTPESDRGLRDLAVRATMENFKELWTGENSTPAVLNAECLKSIPQFEHDLLIAIANKTIEGWEEDGACFENWQPRNENNGEV